MFILENVDSPRTLAATSRACRTLQFEAERLLYREVDVEHVQHVCSLHQALTKSSRRASFVKALRLHLDSGFGPVLPLVNDILLSLTKLTHLELRDYGALGERYDTMLRTLAKCTFRLKSLDSWRVEDSDFVHFLRQQTGLESLHIDGLDAPDWEIPEDALPHLKYVQTFQMFFVLSISGPHAITHLDLLVTESSDQMFAETFRVVRHQLVSLKCRRYTFIRLRGSFWSVILDLLNCGPMPNLKHLEILDDASTSDDSVRIHFAKSLVFSTYISLVPDKPK